MTVTYSLNVSKARLCGFAKLLGRWKGSIYKLLYREMLIYCGLYYGLSFLYRYALSDDHRSVYEKLVVYCDHFTKLIPLSFVLGFYVSMVVGRWWNQYIAIPWPDKAALLIQAHIHGNDERSRTIRRTLVRYLLALQALTFTAVSTAVRKRFPTDDHLVEAGLMTKEEKEAYDEVPGVHGKWWVPASWFATLIIKSRKEGRIKDELFVKQLLEELTEFRGNCGLVFAYDWISIPLVYTQTVTIATYTYFLATVMGRQYLDPTKGYNGHDIDLYIPVFTVLEFFFYMGWLKVAEQLINPFGEDDDDFDLNWMLDRNLLVSMNIVDDMYNKSPKLERDIYWDDPQPTLPYTRTSVQLRTQTQPHHGSTMNLNIDYESEFVPLKPIMEDEENVMYKSEPQSPATEHHVIPSLTDIRGSRIMNMILGQSSENISGSTPKLTERNLNPFSSYFKLKPQRRRARNSETSSRLQSSNSTSLQVSRTSIDEDSILTQSQRNLKMSPPIPKKQLSEESTSLILNIDHNDNDSFVADSPRKLWRNTSFSVDETGKEFKIIKDNDGTIKLEVITSKQPSDADNSVITNDITNDTGVDNNEENRADSIDTDTSQESLTPFETNQDTVTSFTQLLKKSQKE